MSDNDPKHNPQSDTLSERIAAAKRAHDKPEKKANQAKSAGSVSAGAMALRYGVEFGACVFVGIMIGLWIDMTFGSRPWGLLAMLFVGIAAGVLGVIRAYKELTAATNPVMSADETGPDADDR
ncbi:MAG: AtpZ/AtpI family protein [Pseudomonadota bacterium]